MTSPIFSVSQSKKSVFPHSTLDPAPDPWRTLLPHSHFSFHMLLHLFIYLLGWPLFVLFLLTIPLGAWPVLLHLFHGLVLHYQMGFYISSRVTADAGDWLTREDLNCSTSLTTWNCREESGEKLAVSVYIAKSLIVASLIVCTYVCWVMKWLKLISNASWYLVDVIWLFTCKDSLLFDWYDECVST